LAQARSGTTNRVQFPKVIFAELGTWFGTRSSRLPLDLASANQDDFDTHVDGSPGPISRMHWKTKSSR
jgi:hypothetical protein